MNAEEPVMTKKTNSYDEYDVSNAADTLIKAQEIPHDKRKGFYDAVKKEVAKKAAASERAALEARATATLHGLFRKKG